MVSLIAVLEHPIFLAVLSLVLASYAGYAAPRLSPAVLRVVTTDWFRLIVVFLVAFIPRHHFKFALIVAVGYVATSNILLKYSLLEAYHSQVENYQDEAEGFDDEDFVDDDSRELVRVP